MITRWTFTRWRWRHPRLARFLPHRLVSWLVWREAMADPSFVAAMERGLAGVEAGRMVPWAAVKRVLDPAVKEITGSTVEEITPSSSGEPTP